MMTPNWQSDPSSGQGIDTNSSQDDDSASEKEAIRILKDAVNASLTPNSYTDYVLHSDPKQEVIRLAHFLSDMLRKYQDNVIELTQQKHQVDILNHELQTFKYAVDNAYDYVILFDQDMKFTYANKSSLARFGGGQDITGKSITDVLSDLGAGPTAEVEQMLEHIKNGDKHFDTTLTLNDRPNNPTILQIATSVVRDDHNRSIAVNICRDITKELAIDQEKDEFISIASHELRTPMTIIRGYISLLERGQIGEMNSQQMEVLEKISLNTKSTIDLVNDMLELSKLESDTIDIELADKPINHLIHEAIEKVMLLYEGKGIEIAYKPTDDLFVRTNPKMFERIMLNLLTNAYKYTPQAGNVSITSQLDPNGQFMTVCVTDNGVGIPPESIGGLFKKFSQVDSVLHRQAGGSGLGLAICKHMVEKLGGKIWVESVKGEGSKFYFTTPLSENNTKLTDKTIVDNNKHNEV